MTDRDAVYGRLPTGYVLDGRYRIGDLVGKGGTGVIYGAQDLGTGQKVAIKTLNADLLSHPSAVARYHREARSAAGIGHPNICSVLDVGQLPDSRPYLVMELLTGTSLADRIRDHGALSFSLVLNVLTQTLSALEAAHAKKIVHRDIKPDNVFLSDRIKGVIAVKLLDFGIAKSLDENAELSLTRTGMVVGTPFYMAPEQARGEELDHRVDLYACGVMLYEMLTGRRPFHATNYNALMLQVLTAAPPDPRHLRPAIPSEFVPVLLKAMAKDRRDRYTDARSFLAAVWALRTRVDEGLGPEEIDRIAQAIQRPNPFGRAIPDSDSSEDIPIYHESDSPPEAPVSLGMVAQHEEGEGADEGESVTQPFVRPEQLRPFNKPPIQIRPMQSSVEATEVMIHAPWLLDGAEDKAEQEADHASEGVAEPSSPPAEVPSWDDEPTRVEPPPFMPRPKSEPPNYRLDKRRTSKPDNRPPKIRSSDAPKRQAPMRVPRPKKKS
jgi:serine/threonine protein kinase